MREPVKDKGRLEHIIDAISMKESLVIDNIKELGMRLLPKGSSIFLYGSRARGDNQANSDWDLLLLLDKPFMNYKERDDIEFPFVDLGWNLGEDISARAYTKEQWFQGAHTMFYYNVEQDKLLIYES